MSDDNARAKPHDAVMSKYQNDIRLAEEALAHAFDERELAYGRWHVAHSDCCEYGFSASAQDWLKDAEEEYAEKAGLYAEAKNKYDALMQEHARP